MQVLIDDELGEITIKRHWNAKSITMKIIGGRFVATIPQGMRIESIRPVIEKNREMMAKMLKQMPRAERADGHVISNEWLDIRLVSRDTLRTRITRNGHEYTIIHPAGLDRQAIDKAIMACLKNRANEILPDMLDSVARQHGFTCKSLSINSSKKRWGSCSSRGTINLSASLMLLPKHLIVFVITHELCHTVHMNHGEAFKSLLDRCCNGQRQKLEKELRNYTTWQ